MLYLPRYNTIDRDYQIIFADGLKESMTAQELYEFYIIFDHGITKNFEDIKRELDRGEEVYGDDMSFDWNLGTSVFKGRVTFKKINFNSSPKIEVNSNCQHKDKYINQAGGIRFWFCRTCKKDLGDA